MKYWRLGSDTAGTYVLLAHNQDPSGRAITFRLATSSGSGDGPGLAALSSGP